VLGKVIFFIGISNAFRVSQILFGRPAIIILNPPSTDVLMAVIVNNSSQKVNIQHRTKFEEFLAMKFGAVRHLHLNMNISFL